DYLRRVSLYAPGPIDDLLRRARKWRIAVQPGGAGGPSSLLGIFSAYDHAYMERFFNSLQMEGWYEWGYRLLSRWGIHRFDSWFESHKTRTDLAFPRLSDEDIAAVTDASGYLRGWKPLKIGREPETMAIVAKDGSKIHLR